MNKLNTLHYQDMITHFTKCLWLLQSLMNVSEFRGLNPLQDFSRSQWWALLYTRVMSLPAGNVWGQNVWNRTWLIPRGKKASYLIPVLFYFSLSTATWPYILCATCEKTCILLQGFWRSAADFYGTVLEIFFSMLNCIFLAFNAFLM